MVIHAWANLHFKHAWPCTVCTCMPQHASFVTFPFSISTHPSAWSSHIHLALTTHLQLSYLPAHLKSIPHSLCPVVKVYVTLALLQVDELVNVMMFTVYCVRCSNPSTTTEGVVRLAAISLPSGHSTRYLNGQSALVVGGDQVNVTLGGVFIVWLGSMGAPGQAGQYIDKVVLHRVDQEGSMDLN